MTVFRAAIGLVAALVLTACSIPAPDPQAAELAQKMYTQLRTGDDAAIEQEMVPQARGPLLKAQLAQIRTLIPPGEPKSVTQRGWRANATTNGTFLSYVYAYDYGDKVVTSEVVLVRAKEGGSWLVQNFHVNTDIVQAPSAPAAPPPAVSGTTNGGEAPRKAP